MKFVACTPRPGSAHESKQQDSNATCRAQLGGYPLNMLFLANEPAKKAEINILTARDTTGPGF